MQTTCDLCEGGVDAMGVCTACGHHTQLSARERVALLTSAFDERDTELAGGDPMRFPEYANALYAARYETGLDEAVVWGWAAVGDARCALVVFDFRFMGGSMGSATGEKIARAFDAARAERLPVVSVTASGGARMQEGMVSLAQMAKVVEARRRHARSHLPHVALLTSPTTGGVYASFASLADVVLAEPGSHIGFAGPRVARLQTGDAPPHETYTPHSHLAAGLVDEVVARPEQARVLGALLRWLSRGRSEVGPPDLRVFSPAHAPRTAWQRLQLARDPARPKGPAVLDALLAESVSLRGDRGGTDDPAVVARVGALRPTGDAVVAIAHDASAGRVGPAAFRKATRAVKIASRLGIPVLSVVDTPGADPGAAAEAGGVAGAIADTLEAMLGCPCPTIAVVTGEGGSGGAFATTPADRVLVWENAVFSVIAPEAASVILFRRRDRAEELAETLRITAHDLVDLKLADGVVPEPPGGAQSDPATALAILAAEVGRHLTALHERTAQGRLAARRRRWRRAGNDVLREG